MGFDLDKHDLFRNGVPGFIFLFVLFSFYMVKNDLILHTGDNINTFLTVMVIAITLPLGYLIHNIYRAVHIFRELKAWELYESSLIQSVLCEEKPINLKVNELQKDKELSWFIESCLHINSSAPIRERGYHLISRIHSLGGSMAAIFLAIVLSIIILLKVDKLFIDHKLLYLSLVIVWAIIIYLLSKARTSTLNAYKILIKHFVNIRKKIIIDVATKIDCPDPYNN